MKYLVMLLFLFALTFQGCSKENSVISPTNDAGISSSDKNNLKNYFSSSWVDYINNPIFTRLNNPTLPYDVRNSKVIYDDGKYKMWYNADHGSAVLDIWYAESPDGISWTGIGNAPVLPRGMAGTWDSYGVIPTAIIKENGLYKMYYIGQHDYYLNAEWNIGLATSTDGINWIKLPEPVLKATQKYYYIGATDVLKHNGVYFMYFGYISPSDMEHKIGLAKSLDGIKWDFCNHNPILTRTYDWECNGVSYPTVIYDEGKFKMVYQNEVLQSAFGMATSDDGTNFVKDTVPFFTNANTVNNWIRIAYPNFRKLNNEYRIYYSGEQPDNVTTICLIQKMGSETTQTTQTRQAVIYNN